VKEVKKAESTALANESIKLNRDAKFAKKSSRKNPSKGLRRNKFPF
jgi:hypothetical protein